MTLIINGETRETSAATVLDLLGELNIPEGRVAVEVNFAVIGKSDYASCRLKDGDKVEIVNFVGGG